MHLLNGLSVVAAVASAGNLAVIQEIYKYTSKQSILSIYAIECYLYGMYGMLDIIIYIMHFIILWLLTNSLSGLHRTSFTLRNNNFGACAYPLSAGALP